MKTQDDTENCQDHGMAHTVLSLRETCAKVYFPQHGELRVHQSRVCLCPPGFPAGYGTKRKGPRRPPRWVDQLLSEGPAQVQDGDHVEAPATTPAPLTDDQPATVGENAQEDMPLTGAELQPANVPEDDATTSNPTPTHPHGEGQHKDVSNLPQDLTDGDEGSPDISTLPPQSRNPKEKQRRRHSQAAIPTPHQERDRRLRRVVKPPNRLF